MTPHRSVKKRFARDIILVLLAVSAAVIGPVVYFSAQAQRDISKKFIDAAAQRAVGEFQSMAGSMISALELVGDWGTAGKVSLNDTEGLNGLLFPMLNRDHMLFGISIADTDGDSYYVIAHEEGWQTDETDTSDVGRRSVVRFWDAEQRPLSQEINHTEYDPRQRPWFFPALSIDGVFWTEPYKFYDRKDVGITASVAFDRPKDNRQMVAAFDILLDDLFREIHRMAPSENSRVFIFRRDAQLYIPESDGSQPDFKSISTVEDPLAQKIHTAWMGSQQPADQAFSIRTDDGVWWCGIRPLERANRNIWIGVTVPETDIVGDVSHRRTTLWMVAVFALLFAGSLAFWMIRRYGRPADDNTNRYNPNNPQDSIRRLINTGEGRTIEFKATMRMNLHTQKPGKEIEIAWLKAVAAFLNTQGGTLLLGVTDAGEISGLESDGFENQDKCKLHFKNLISQHIGAEISRYLRFNIIEMDQKRVGVVACSRSADPVFLKTGKNEAFYIRNGPSSDVLPVSKVLKYLQNRKK